MSKIVIKILLSIVTMILALILCIFLTKDNNSFNKIICLICIAVIFSGLFALVNAISQLKIDNTKVNIQINNFFTTIGSLLLPVIEIALFIGPIILFGKALWAEDSDAALEIMFGGFVCWIIDIFLCFSFTSSNKSYKNISTNNSNNYYNYNDDIIYDNDSNLAAPTIVAGLALGALVSKSISDAYAKSNESTNKRVADNLTRVSKSLHERMEEDEERRKYHK